MTEEAREASNHLTWPARFENDFLEYVVIYCIDPLTPEEEDFLFDERKVRSRSVGNRGWHQKR